MDLSHFASPTRALIVPDGDVERAVHMSHDSSQDDDREQGQIALGTLHEVNGRVSNLDLSHFMQGLDAGLQHGRELTDGYPQPRT